MFCNMSSETIKIQSIFDSPTFLQLLPLECKLDLVTHFQPIECDRNLGHKNTAAFVLLSYFLAINHCEESQV